MSEEANGLEGPTALTEANLSTHDSGYPNDPNDSEYVDPQDTADDKWLDDELKRVGAIEDEKEREEAMIEYREKRRELLKDKIKRMHSRMEQKLQEEVQVYEDMEEQEAVATWELDQRMKEREGIKRRAAEDKARKEEEQRRAAMTEADMEREVEERRLQFIVEAMKGQLFLQHKRNLFGKAVKSEKFIRISVYEHGEPRAITWGGGGSKKMVEFLDIVNIVTGHVTQVLQDSRPDPALCFSIVTTKRTLDLEAHDDETCNAWVDGLRLIIRNLDSDNDKSVEPTRVGGEDGPQSADAEQSPQNKSPTHIQKDSNQITQGDLFVLTVETVLKQGKDDGLNPPDDFDCRRDGKKLYRVILKERVQWRGWNDWVQEQLKKGFPALQDPAATGEEQQEENAQQPAGDNPAQPGEGDDDEEEDGDAPNGEENGDD